MTPGEAGRTTRRRLGSAAELRDEHREALGFPRLEELVGDARYGLRAPRSCSARSAVNIWLPDCSGRLPVQLSCSRSLVYTARSPARSRNVRRRSASAVRSAPVNRAVLCMVMGRALRLTLIGVAGGLVAASALTRVLENFLFKVATDPATFAGTAALFVFVAVLAGLVPARRAARIDPMKALRV